MCCLPRGPAEGLDGVCTGPEEAPFSKYSKVTTYLLGGLESYNTVKTSDVETILDEVVREDLGTEIQMMRSSKGRVFRAENTQQSSSEAETNLVSMRTENKA